MTKAVSNNNPNETKSDSDKEFYRVIFSAIDCAPPAVFVEINPHLCTVSVLRKIINTDGKGKERMANGNGVLLDTALKLIARVILESCNADTGYDYENSVIGGIKIDGSSGIKILLVDQIMFDEDEMKIVRL